LYDGQTDERLASAMAILKDGRIDTFYGEVTEGGAPGLQQGAGLPSVAPFAQIRIEHTASGALAHPCVDIEQ
jgi:hypothetical protein